MIYGSSVEGYLIETFLKMLTSQIDFDIDMELSNNLIKQSNYLRSLRKGYSIN